MSNRAIVIGGGIAGLSAAIALRKADLLIVADGIHSRLATRLLGNAPVYQVYSGVLALSGRE